jgi:uncharacterized protein
MTMATAEGRSIQTQHSRLKGKSAAHGGLQGEAHMTGTHWLSAKAAPNLDAFCAFAVMAKAPRPDMVKTRLVPPLRPEEATALSASFLRDITENIRLVARTAPIQPFVAYAPAGLEAVFDGILAPQTGLVLADGMVEMPPRVRGFGRSLLHAVRALFAYGYGAVCLVNSDSPNLPTATLRQAAEALAAPGERIVLAPAEDGGYCVIGMKTPHAHLFEDIHWSTEHVAAETCDRARALGLEVVALPSWYDVDDQASLSRLIDELFGVTKPAAGGPMPYPAFATVGCIARLGLAKRVGRPERTRNAGTATHDIAP